MDDENRDLVNETKEGLENSKEYNNIGLELNKIIIDSPLVKKIQNNENEESVKYDIYIKFKKENVKIATIDAEGNLIPNREFLEDDHYTDEEKEDLGNMLNLLGLESNKIDLDKLEQQLKEFEERNAEETFTKEQGDNIKDDLDEKEDDNKEDKEEEKDEDKEKDLEDLEQEKEQEAIANKKHIDPKNICKIRKDSQFYKNYPNIPKTAYFYLDKNDNIHAEYIDNNGEMQELAGFNQIKDRPRVTSFGKDGKQVQEKLPYRVMSATGLEDKNHNTQDIRIAIYKDNYGYLRLETIHQGRNGEWEGKSIDTYGTERNSARMNKLIDEKHRTPGTGKLAENYELVKDSGLSDNGIQMHELIPEAMKNKWEKEGFTKDEMKKIFHEIVDNKLEEDKAKNKVKAERDENQKTPWGDAEARRNRNR